MWHLSASAPETIVAALAAQTYSLNILEYNVSFISMAKNSEPPENQDPPGPWARAQPTAYQTKYPRRKSSMFLVKIFTVFLDLKFWKDMNSYQEEEKCLIGLKFKSFNIQMTTPTLLTQLLKAQILLAWKIPLSPLWRGKRHRYCLLTLLGLMVWSNCNLRRLLFDSKFFNGKVYLSTKRTNWFYKLFEKLYMVFR